MGVLTIVMPAYNEAARIIPMLSDLHTVHLMYPGFIEEIIVVDDGSKDATVERLSEYQNKIPLKIIRMRENGGKWSAVRAGLRDIKGQLVCLMDADASVLLSQEMKIFGYNKNSWQHLATLLNNKRVVLAGSRFHKNSVVEGKSVIRKIVSRGYRAFVRYSYWSATRKIAPDDMQCPFKIIPSSMIKGGIEFMTAEKFAGDIELLFVIDPNACVDVPVTFIHRAGSKIKPATAYQMFKETRAFVKRKKYINKFISNGSVVSASGTNAHDENGGNL